MTSADKFVTPHAICSLCPLITPGTPGNAAPETFNPGAFKCTKCHVPGMRYARCGSFAAIGLASAVCMPETAQAFDPKLTNCPSIAGKSVLTLAGSAIASNLPFESSNLELSVKSRNIASPTNTESVTLQGRGS